LNRGSIRAVPVNQSAADTATLLIVILLILFLFGGGYYGRGRWW
jgi:hypothetical protein